MATEKKSPVQKHKTKVAVLDANKVQAQCVCGWKGNPLVGKTSLIKAIAAGQAEADAHIPKKVKNDTTNK